MDNAVKMLGIYKDYWNRINTNFLGSKASWNNENKDKKIQLNEITINGKGVNKEQTTKLLNYYQILCTNNTFPELIMTLDDPDIIKAMEEIKINKDSIKVGNAPFNIFSDDLYYVIEPTSKDNSYKIVVDSLSTDMVKLKKDLLDACKEIKELKNKN